MSRAIELALKASMGERSGGCFGAVIVKDDEIIADGYNQVLTKHDATCHAEMQAIRAASKYLGTHDLNGCVMYTSSQPCPMCLCACAWARISNIVYASTVDDAKEYGGFDDQAFYNDLFNGKIVCMTCDTDAREEMLQVWKMYQASNPTHY